VWGFLLKVVRLACACFVLALFLALTSSAAADTKLADVTIPASDGVNLSGDVYLPGTGTGKYT